MFSIIEHKKKDGREICGRGHRERNERRRKKEGKKETKQKDREKSENCIFFLRIWDKKRTGVSRPAKLTLGIK